MRTPSAPGVLNPAQTWRGAPSKNQSHRRQRRSLAGGWGPDFSTAAAQAPPGPTRIAFKTHPAGHGAGNRATAYRRPTNSASAINVARTGTTVWLLRCRNGQVEIDANVTEFLPAADEQAPELFAARRNFETGDRPELEVGAARPRVISHAASRPSRTFARRQGLSDLRLAANRWYAMVFRPLWQTVRARASSRPAFSWRSHGRLHLRRVIGLAASDGAAPQLGGPRWTPSSRLRRRFELGVSGSSSDSSRYG